MAMAGASDPGRLGRSGWVRLALLTAGPGALLDGALVYAVGEGSLLGAPYHWTGLAPALVVLGAAATVIALLPSPATALRSVRPAVPRLLPYAGDLVNIGVFLLWVFSTVAIYQGCLDIFAGAHAGGGGFGVPDPARLQALIAIASALFTLLPLYLALALRRLIPMGRWADSSDGRDAYGGAVAPPDDAIVAAAMRAGAPSQAPRDRRGAVAIATVITAAFAAIGIQLVEAGTAPIPPGLWLESQAALPIYSAALVLGVLAVDSSVRGLEARFFERVRPLGPVPTAPAGPGFVQ